MLNIEFNNATPQEIRQQITESLEWIDGSNVRKILIASRMENLYMRGMLDGVTAASERALNAIRNIGGAK